jgi:hypothetical protein
VPQDIRLMHPIREIRNPDGATNVYELRYYRTKPGAAKEWSNHFMSAMPVREKYSKMVAHWIGEAGQPNEVLHLWAYPDLNARMEARAGAGKDPGWQEFVKKAGSLLEELNNIVMLPAAHSPLQ